MFSYYSKKFALPGIKKKSSKLETGKNCHFNDENSRKLRRNLPRYKIMSSKL